MDRVLQGNEDGLQNEVIKVPELFERRNRSYSNHQRDLRHAGPVWFVQDGLLTRTRNSSMAATPPIDPKSSDASIDAMSKAFDYAIQKSAEITALTTEKKVELDAAKQRPNA